MASTQPNSICFLCYKTTSLRNKSQDGNYCSNKFIQILSKHLNPCPTIDVKTLLSRFEGVVAICNDWFGLGESMCQLYSQWDLLKFKLDCRLRDVCKVMTTADAKFSSTLVNEKDAAGSGQAPNGVSRDLQNLRKELFKDYQKTSDSSPPSFNGETYQENGPVPSPQPNSTVTTIWNPFEHSIDNRQTDPIAASTNIPVCHSTSALHSSFNCRRCPAKFESHVLLTVHIRNAHDITKRFKCTICGARSLHPSKFRVHMRHIHNTISGLPGRFHCYMCNEKFKTLQSRDYHLTYIHKVHTYTGHFRFVCNFNGCSKRLKTQRGLQVHYRTHTGEKPYKCDWPRCDAMFQYHGARKTHYNNTHRTNTSCAPTSKALGQAVSTTIPNQPDFETAGQSMITQHQQQQPIAQQQTSQVIQMDALLQNQCTICHASFSTGEQLTAHLIVEHIHSNTEKHGCNFQAYTPTNYVYPEIGWSNNYVSHQQHQFDQYSVPMNSETGSNAVATLADHRQSSSSVYQPTLPLPASYLQIGHMENAEGANHS